MPSDLNAVYARVLNAIPVARTDMVRSVLTSLITAMRPLSLKEIAEVAVLRQGVSTMDENARLLMPHEVIDICQGLMEYEGKATDSANDISDTVTLAHSSVRAFLTSHTETSWYNLDILHSHGEVAKKCLQYLLFDNFKVGFADNAAFKTLHEQFPLLDYAAQHWPMHAKLSRQPELWLPEAKDFCSTFSQAEGANFTFWVQCLMPKSSKLAITRTEPLYYASSFNLMELVTELLASGANVEARGGRAASTALHVACHRGHIDIARVLLENGANLDYSDAYGVTPLYWAAVNRRKDIVELLENLSWKGSRRGRPSTVSGYKGDYASLAAESWRLVGIYDPGESRQKHGVESEHVFIVHGDADEWVCCECDAGCTLASEGRCMICLHAQCGHCILPKPEDIERSRLAVSSHHLGTFVA